MKVTKKSLLNIFSFFISVCGVTKLIRHIFYKNSLTILVYHDPSPDVFLKHIEFLHKRYSLVNIDSAIMAVNNNNIKILGDYPLVITIDDGHKGNYLLLSIIKKYGVRPCIFLCSSIMNTNRAISDIYIQKHNLGRLREFKEQTELSKRNMFYGMYSLQFESELSERVTMSLDEMIEMQPWVDFGSHGRFHQAISYLSRREMCNEIYGSKKEIHELLGIECKHFAFPSGYYNNESIKVIEDAGYLSARTTESGINKKNNVFSLKVTGASDDASIYKLDVQSVGIYRFLRKHIKPLAGNK